MREKESEVNKHIPRSLGNDSVFSEYSAPFRQSKGTLAFLNRG